MDDIHARYTQHLRAQARSKASGVSQSFKCPYCPDSVFPEDDILWEHVRINHVDQLEAVSLANQGNSALYRKLLREEALHKGKLAAEKANKEQWSGDSISDAAAAGSAHVTSSINEPQKSSSRAPTGTRRNVPPNGLVAPGKREIDPDFSRTIPRTPAVQKGAHHHLYDPNAPRIKPEEHVRSLPLVAPQTQRLSGSSQPPHGAASLALSLSPEASNNKHAQQERGVIEMPSNARWPNLLLQPDSRPISQEQLAAEVKSIYAGLVMVENKCISVDRAQASAAQEDANQPSKLVGDHWQALIALHRTLLHEHHDFFLASQHPSASPALKRLAAKYSMPARMWKHGIHSFLELLRRRLPESLDYMLAFIYLAYQMMALLYETVPAFEDTWIECLGDLGRYRMAIEDEDLRDRETWAGVARFWYSKAADKSPSVGRLYHHLAILARPNALQQLYYYSRSLTCLQPFMSARESILTLLDPILGRTHATYSHADPVDANFIRAHGLLFVQENLDRFEPTTTDYLDQLDKHIGRVTSKWKEQGVYIAVTNIAGLFDYGSQDSILRQFYDAKLKLNTSNQTPRTVEPQVAASTGPTAPSTPPPDTTSDDDNDDDDDVSSLLNKLDLNSQLTFKLACRLTFSTFQLVVQRIGDKNVLPHVHVLLSFIFSLISIPYDTAIIFAYAPWEDIAAFLNTLSKSDKLDSVAEKINFPRYGETDTKPLPEDYLIQGQIWSHLYFPANWFKVAHDEEERSLELASTVKSRTERILWLGVQIASRGHWLDYDETLKTWSATTPSAGLNRGQGASSPHQLSSNSSSDAMELEVYPTPQSHRDSSPHIDISSHEPMEGVIPVYTPTNTKPSLRKQDPRSSTQKYVKNVILRNYTIFICEKSMLLQQSDVFLMLLDSGDWKVVIPESVIIELGSLSKSSGVWKTSAGKALGKIRAALLEGRNLHIADTQGSFISDPAAALDRLVETGMEVDDSAEDVAIGVTRRQSDLNSRGNLGGFMSHPEAKPAILVSEDKATRIKARTAGVASIAASKIRKFVSSSTRRPEEPIGHP